YSARGGDDVIQHANSQRRVDAGGFHFAVHGNALRRVLQHRDSCVSAFGLQDSRLHVAFRNLRSHGVGSFPGDLDLTDEGKDDVAAGIDSERAGKIRVLEHADLNQVTGTDGENRNRVRGSASRILRRRGKRLQEKSYQ